MARLLIRDRTRRGWDGTPGFRVSLKKYGNGHGAWLASFNRDVLTAADGFVSGPTLWAAVQEAAWQ
jgi:hypothetical protein